MSRVVSRVDMERLRALVEVATDQKNKIPPSWWESFGRECADVLPSLLDGFEAEREVAEAALAHTQWHADAAPSGGILARDAIIKRYFDACAALRAIRARAGR